MHYSDVQIYVNYWAKIPKTSIDFIYTFEIEVVVPNNESNTNLKKTKNESTYTLSFMVKLLE